MTTTEAELEEKAMSDHKALVGKVVEIDWVSGYIGDDSFDIHCQPPAKVRIVKTDDDSIHHWNDEWLDPYYDIELVEPHPALKDARSLWINGPSYNLKTLEVFGSMKVVSEDGVFPGVPMS